jgi:hypothetical protein
MIVAFILVAVVLGSPLEAEVAEGAPGSMAAPAATGTSAVFGGVTCVTKAICTAVGTFVKHSNKTLAETWNGSTWELVTTPNPIEATYSQLNSVACFDASKCFAVGNYFYKPDAARTLAEYWNGTKWEIVSTPNPTGAKWSALNSIVCSSASWCMAVGIYYLTSPVTGYGLTLAEVWNGSVWAVASTQNPTGANGSALTGVSCQSTSLCEAVGNYHPNSSDSLNTLGEAWNGVTWRLVTTPNPAAETRSLLDSVDCTDSKCMAVGDYVDTLGDVLTLAESWNGATWKLIECESNGTQRHPVHRTFL